MCICAMWTYEINSSKCLQKDKMSKFISHFLYIIGKCLNNPHYKITRVVFLIYLPVAFYMFQVVLSLRGHCLRL